jgi:hypothetical protein
MKIVKVIGKWEWMLDEGGVVYKRYEGSGKVQEWGAPSWMDVEAEMAKLYGGVSSVVEAPKEVEKVSVKAEAVPAVVKERVLKSVVSVRTEQRRRKKSGDSRLSGRPRKELSEGDIVRGRDLLGKGMSLSSVCRCLGISRGLWYRRVAISAATPRGVI